MKTTPEIPNTENPLRPGTDFLLMTSKKSLIGSDETEAMGKHVSALTQKNIPHEDLGGLTGDARILCEGMVWRRIDDIVSNRVPANIVAHNEITGQFEMKRIIDCIKSPVDKKMLRKLSVTHPSGFKRCLYLSGDQGVYTQRGIVRVDDLKPDDTLYMRSLSITEQGIQALIGMRLGDGSIRRHGKNGQKAVFTVAHGEKQRDYCAFIGEKFHVNCNDWVSRAASKSYNANQVAISLRVLWPDGCNLLPPLKGVNDWMLDHMGWQSIAYWYMDDGTIRGSDTPQFSSHAFSRDDVTRLTDCLKKKFGIIGSWIERKSKGYGDINIAYDSRDLFFRGIAPFVHPCIRYKIPQRFHEIKFLQDIKFVEYGSVACRTSARRVVGGSNIRHCVDDILREGETYYKGGLFTPDFRYVYNLKVAGNFNFLAEDIILQGSSSERLS